MVLQSFQQLLRKQQKRMKEIAKCTLFVGLLHKFASFETKLLKMFYPHYAKNGFCPHWLDCLGSQNRKHLEFSTQNYYSTKSHGNRLFFCFFPLSLSPSFFCIFYRLICRKRSKLSNSWYLFTKFDPLSINRESSI